MKIWPWSKIARLQGVIQFYRRRDDEMARRIELGMAENKRLAAVVNDQRKQLASVRPLDPGAVGAMETDRQNRPDFVMLGLTRPAGLGVRLYASRDLPQAQFGPPPMARDYSAGAYLLHSVMSNMLVVDKPTYDEALARVREIWANWDRDKALAIEDAKLLGHISPETIRELTALNEPPELEMPK